MGTFSALLTQSSQKGSQGHWTIMEKAATTERVSQGLAGGTAQDKPKGAARTVSGGELLDMQAYTHPPPFMPWRHPLGLYTRQASVPFII